MKLSRISLSVGLFFMLSSCAKSPVELENGTDNSLDELFIVPDTSNMINIADYLPVGYVEDGTVDYTEYIQEAIDENTDIAFPDFPLMINDGGISLRSNSNVFFNRNSSLILAPTANGTYKMVYLNNVENLKVFNPTLIGDRNNHLGTNGEHGMGLRIHDSKDIEIYNVDIKDMWGDGIYITSYTVAKGNNILIKYGLIDNVRRNGVSVISGRNITVDSVQISNINGVPPASGIDVEPNSETDVIDNLKLMNVSTLNNERDGIILDFTNLVHSEVGENVGVTISNHQDNGSRYGFRFAALRNTSETDEVLPGQVIVEDSKWDNPRINPLRIGAETTYYPDVLLKNLQTNTMTQSEFVAVIDSLIANKTQFQYIE